MLRHSLQFDIQEYIDRTDYTVVIKEEGYQFLEYYLYLTAVSVCENTSSRSSDPSRLK